MNVSKNLSAIIAVIMVVSMVAVGATAVGAVGTQSAVEDTTLSTSEEVGVTGVLTDSFHSSGAQSTPELGSQSAQVADQLEDASGETTVLLKVDRNIQLEGSLPSEFSSEELEQDSEATLQPVVDSVNSLSNAEVTQRMVIGNALAVEIDLDQHDIDQLATIPGVEAVAPNIKFEHPAQLDESTGAVSPSNVTVPDPDAEYTWGLQQIGVPSFDEQFDVRGEGANVTIIDDGISDGDHPDLEFAQKVNIVDNEINVGAIGVTDNAHGEHVAGTATGALDPAGDVPRYGVAPNASLTKINVFEGTPGASFANILTAVDYAVTERNADVAGMSLGAGGPFSTVASIVDAQMREAKAAGTLVTVSAGNEGDFFQGGDEGAPVSTPATEFDAFSVGASADQPVVINTTEAFPPSIPSSIAAFTGSNNDITQFSSGAIVSDRRSLDLIGGTVGVGDFYPDDYPRQYVQPDVAAPGLFVLSSGPLGNDAGAPGVNATSDGYSWTQGTSMAQPHVAGAVALIQSATEEDLGPQEISAALTETAEKPDNASEKFPSIGERDIRYGAGIINVTAAALAAQNMTEATGTVTDDAGEPVTGASLETEEGALVRTIDGEYSLASTESTPNVTVNAYGFDPVTEELTSGDQTFTLDRDLTVTEVVQGQPNITESGGEFTIVADVASVETFTLELSDSSSFLIGVDERDLTASIAGVGEIPFGQPVPLGNFTGLAEITVSISETADVATGDQLLLDHTFEGSGESVSVTTGPTTLVDAAGAVSSVSIDADFIGTINDQPTTTVTAEGILKDGEPSTGDRLTFTIGGEPVATAVSDDGVATAEVNAEALDLGPQEDVTVDVLEFEAAQTDTVDIVDEVADLEEGFNLLSVPQPATLTTQDVSSLNVWDSGDETYDAVTSPEFDTASDLHDGLYVDAGSDNARLGFTFNEDVPVGGTQDVNTDWNLLGANFPLDSEDIGNSTSIENDLTGVNAAALELFRGDFSEFLNPGSQVGPYEAYWAFNPATSADERGIASPSYDEGDRRDVLGQGDADFQPTITSIETTSVEDADDEVTLDDRDVVGASEQVVLVDVTVENNGDGTDVQFVTLEVAPQLGSGSGFELADQTGIELGPGESGDVTLAFVASQDDVSPLPPFFVPDDVAIEVTTEDGDAEDVGIPFDEGGITVDDQALSTDGEFVVQNVDVAGHGTVQLVDANDNVLDSVEFAQGINEEVTFTVDDPANVTDDVTVRVLDDNELEELTSETVDVLDTRFTVFNNAPEFALVNETVDVPVTVTSNVAVPEDDVSVNFSVGGTDAGSQTVDLGVFGTETVSFPVDTTGLSVGDTVEHTATSPDDSDTRTLTIAEATLAFNDQSLNADGEVLVEDVTADEDQTIVVTDTDLNVVGEVDVANITTPGERGIDDEDVLVDVTGTSAGTHIAHVVADDFTVPGEGPGLVNQEANITVSTVDLADIDSQTVSEAALPVEVVSSVTVDSEVVDAVGDRNSNYTVEIRQGGTVVGASDNLSDVSNGLTIDLDDPVVVDEAQPEQTFTLTAVLVDQNGNEFDVSAGTNLDDDGFPVLTGNLDSAADEESFTVTVSGAENVNLPDQALGAANGSDAVLVNNIAADDDQFVVITPADNNSNILGVTQFDGDVSGGERIVEFDQEVSAGEFRAHITTDTGLLGDDGALVTDTGSVFNASVSITNQTFVGGTDELTVDSSNLQAEDPANYQIVVHDQTRANSSAVGPAPDDVGPPLGVSDVLTGSESDVTIDLGQSITSTQDVLVMLHFTNPGASGPGGAIPVLNGSAFGFSDGQNGTITDTATVSSIESAQTFNDQALTTSDILIEDVQVNQTSAVVVTYPNDGNLTIAGLETSVTGTDAQDVPVTINDAGGFPGEHTVHIIPESGLSQGYSAGDNVSSETAANITSQESATVFDASVTIDDQAFEDSTSTLNITTSDLQPATASDYVVVVHNQTGQPAEAGPADTDVGPALGATGVLNGSQENATVNLFEPLDETTDVLVMIHFPNAAGTGPGMPIPTLNGGNFGITDGSAGTITDTATVTIEQAEGGNVTFSDQALGSNGDVVVENVQPVDAVEVTTNQAFNPQDDFLVLTEGTEVTGENDIIDFVQLSDVANGADVALNATGASPGTHTVVLHEPNETGDAPDPTAPRTNASSGEVVNATATVFDGSVTVETDELNEEEEPLDEIDVSASLVGATEFNVTVTGDATGTVTGLSGDAGTVTVGLDQELADGETVTATIERNGSAVQQATSAPGFQDLDDDNTISVIAANFQLSGLTIDSQTPPANVDSGTSPVDVGFTVENTGDAAAEASLTLNVTADSSGDSVLTDTRTTFTLNPGDSLTTSFSDVDLGALDPAGYEVNVSTEDDTVTGGLTVEGTNFNVSGLDIDGQGDNATIREDDSFDVTATVENLGNEQGTQDIVVSITDAGGNVETSATQTVSNLAGGSSTTVTFSGLNVDVGTTTEEFTVSVSSENATVTGDLTVNPLNIGVSITDVDVTNNEIDFGDGPTQVEVTLSNEANQQLNSQVTVEVVDNETGPTGVSASRSETLNAGDTLTTSFDLATGTLDGGNYSINATTDTDEDSVAFDINFGDVSNLDQFENYGTLDAALSDVNNDETLRIDDVTLNPSGNLTLSNSNVRIFGQGTAATTVQTNLTVSGDDNTLENFTVEGNVTLDGTDNDIDNITVTSASPGGTVFVNANASLNGVTAIEIVVGSGATATVSDSDVDSVTGDGTTTFENPSPGQGEVFVDDVSAGDTVAETFDSIQAANDAAADGATLTLGSGTFSEEVTVDVTGVTIGSADGVTSTVSASSGTVFTVTADDVTIDGVTIEANSGSTGVDASGATNLVLQNNNFETDSSGTVYVTGESGLASDLSTVLGNNNFDPSAVVDAGEIVVSPTDVQIDSAEFDNGDSADDSATILGSFLNTATELIGSIVVGFGNIAGNVGLGNVDVGNVEVEVGNQEFNVGNVDVGNNGELNISLDENIDLSDVDNDAAINITIDDIDTTEADVDDGNVSVDFEDTDGNSVAQNETDSSTAPSISIGT